MGQLADFERTAVKISNHEVLKEFKGSNFTKIPKLKERRWLVASASNGVYPIYHSGNLDQFNGKANIQWGILKISEELHKTLLRDVVIDDRIVFTNLDSRTFNQLSLKAKEPKYYPIDKITEIKRIEKSSCCVLL